MNRADKSMFLAKLKNRAERLGKLISLNAPDSIIERECGMVFEVMIPLFPKALGKSLFGMAGAHVIECFEPPQEPAT